MARMVFCLGAVYFIPWGMSLYLEDGCAEVFFTCFLICNFVGYLLNHYARFNKYSQTITNREGVATATFSWVLCAALAGMPYWMTGELDLFASFFEAPQRFILAWYYPLAGWSGYHRNFYLVAATYGQRCLSSFCSGSDGI